MRNRFESFAEYIVELYRALQKIKEVEMSHFQLKANHTMCLYYLGKYPEGLTATQLTGMCKEDKAAISRCLNQLIQKNLVISDLTEQKRSYRTLHFLTSEGKEVVSKMKERITEAVSNGGKGLTEEQRSAFYESMELILSNLSKYLEEQENIS